MSGALYLRDTYLFESQGQIIDLGQDEKGAYLTLDQTIFYPQGGGQPSDQGMIKINSQEIPVSLVRQVNQEIRHYTPRTREEWQDARVTFKIDKERRLRNARYHTAGQLIGNLIEEKFEQAKVLKSHHWPNEASMEFSGVNLSATDIPALNCELDEMIKQNHPIHVFQVVRHDFSKVFCRLVAQEKYGTREDLRAVQIEGFNAVPCGGTHLTSLREIGNLYIKKISTKGLSTKISYEVLFSEYQT